MTLYYNLYQQLFNFFVDTLPLTPSATFLTPPYSNWMGATGPWPAQPDNFGGQEHYAEMHGNDWPSRFNVGSWNDNSWNARGRTTICVRDAKKKPSHDEIRDGGFPGPR